MHPRVKEDTIDAIIYIDLLKISKSMLKMSDTRVINSEGTTENDASGHRNHFVKFRFIYSKRMIQSVVVIAHVN